MSVVFGENLQQKGLQNTQGLYNLKKQIPSIELIMFCYILTYHATDQCISGTKY